MPKQIFLIRHGETEWSLSGRHTGRTDLALTETGERRATELGGKLRGVTFTHVFTSPRQRARRTCELAGLSAGAREEPDLQEWDYGAYEGQTTAAIRAVRPGWNIFQDGCPDGESVEQISGRADRLIAKLRELDGTIALFSHGHFLRSLAVRWIELPLNEGRHLVLDTASLSILEFGDHDGRTPVISLWNRGANA